MNKNELFQQGIELWRQGDGEGRRKAIDCFRMAADLGHTDAMYCLGLYCEEHIEDYYRKEPKTVEWYTKAALAGCVEAQFRLGWYYERSPVRLLIQEGADALRTMVANTDDSPFFGKSEGDLQNYKFKALKWYRMAAQNGHREAKLYLGLIYDQGIGPDSMEMDKEEAERLYLEAAEQGSPAAQCRMAFLYMFGGQTIEKDPEKALDWFKKAAENGSDTARYCLGICCEKGIGTVKDEQAARQYYRSVTSVPAWTASRPKS